MDLPKNFGHLIIGHITKLAGMHTRLVSKFWKQAWSDYLSREEKLHYNILFWKLKMKDSHDSVKDNIRLNPSYFHYARKWAKHWVGGKCVLHEMYDKYNNLNGWTFDYYITGRIKARSYFAHGRRVATEFYDIYGKVINLYTGDTDKEFEHCIGEIEIYRKKCGFVM